ncbi:prolipoprotein diacylglyceryl transferase [Rasiella rasia]|uniref:Phosphatidylglycerol--prolipoprotein diacylglyceryl transferase n=1 Tax=Rasiella rasia TaxID=2744027 RepID=A0A6G6GL67_9FLAO|nr:prolipoprotein diacylglyceryl transferase [Rasiella rasia]QIE59153.1 prolipoprotein diacylglyceryl transferase [Rasiella rasia]
MLHFLSTTWNPSEGIDLGFFMIRFYSLSYVVAFVIGWFIMKRFYKNDNISMEKLDSLFIYMVLAILIGARLGHVFFYETELLWEDPLSVVLPFKTVPEFEFTGFRGLASHGAAIGIVIALLLYNKRVLKKPALWIFDRVVITVAIGGAFVRFGNFMNSEIVGKASGGHPFGIKMLRHDIFPQQAVKATGIKDVNKAYDAIANNAQFSELLATVPLRHPAQLYEALGYIITFLVCWFIYWKTPLKKHVGYIFGWFLILLFMTRFVVEFFKEVQVDGRETWLLNTGQLLSIPFILAGFYFLLRSKKTEYTA